MYEPANENPGSLFCWKKPAESISLQKSEMIFSSNPLMVG